MKLSNDFINGVLTGIVLLLLFELMFFLGAYVVSKLDDEEKAKQERKRYDSGV